MISKTIGFRGTQPIFSNTPKSKAWWKHVKMVKIPRIQYKPRQIHTSPWGAVGPWEHRLFLAARAAIGCCFQPTKCWGDKKKYGNAATSATLGTYPQSHRSYRSRKKTQRYTKYIKVYQSHSCGEWSILANTSQMTGWADIDCRYFNGFNIF